MEIKNTEIQSEPVSRITDISGTNLLKCYQCGNCSAGCPMVQSMDVLPNQIVRLAQLGKWEEVMRANTPWICAACMTCSVRCPRGIKIAEAIEAMRQVFLRNRNSDRRLGLSQEELVELPPIALISAYRKIAE
jgi:heterodisulfide reductase subunit C